MKPNSTSFAPSFPAFLPILTSIEIVNTMISRQIDGIDRGIDRLVYELYGLSEDEVKIIEGD